jgi:hypothetical protein
MADSPGRLRRGQCLAATPQRLRDKTCVRERRLMILPAGSLPAGENSVTFPRRTGVPVGLTVAIAARNVAGTSHTQYRHPSAASAPISASGTS